MGEWRALCASLTLRTWENGGLSALHISNRTWENGGFSVPHISLIMGEWRLSVPHISPNTPRVGGCTQGVQQVYIPGWCMGGIPLGGVYASLPWWVGSLPLSLVCLPMYHLVYTTWYIPLLLHPGIYTTLVHMPPYTPLGIPCTHHSLRCNSCTARSGVPLEETRPWAQRGGFPWVESLSSLSGHKGVTVRGKLCAELLRFSLRKV